MKSFFQGTKKHIPKRRVDKWGHEEVLRWLSNVDLAPYADTLQQRGIAGPELLRLSQMDVHELARSHEDAERWLVALAGLHKREGSSVDLLAGTKLAAGSTPSTHSGRPSSSGSQVSSLERGPSNGAAFFQGMVTHFGELGITGKGLETAAQGSPLVGPIIGALWDLHKRCQEAKGFRHNCLELDAHARNILRVFDAEGRRLATLAGGPLRRLLELVQEANALVDSCCKPGWMALLLNEEKTDSFVAVHNATLQLLKDERLDVLPNGSHLAFGNYGEASRPLKRVLKQVGGGSVEGGLAAVQHNDQAMRELVGVLNIDAKIILRELHDSMALPEAAQPGMAAAMPHAGSAATPTAKPDSAQDADKDFSKEYDLIFNQYNKSRSGALSCEDFRCVMADLGALDGVPAAQADEWVGQAFRQAGADRGGALGAGEFSAYYRGAGASRARLELRSTLGPATERDLQKVFCSFASFGVRQHLEEMDGAKFAKLCRDTKLLTRGFTPTDVDLFFAKVKTKGARRITFSQFADALALVAAKKGTPLAEVAGAVLAADGPSVSGTRADYVKFHDDKSTYTGVYKKGGPTTVEPGRQLSDLLDRSPADVRGIKRSTLAAQADPPLLAQPGGADSPLVPTPPSGAPAPRMRPPAPILTNLTPSHGSGSYGASPGGVASPASVGNGGSHAKFARPPTPDSSRAGNDRIKAAWEPVSDEELHAAFRAFANFGSGSGSTPKSATPRPFELDGARFAKLVRDSGLLDSRMNTTAVDLVFSRVKPKGARKIDYAAFERALPLLAGEKGLPLDEVRRAVVLSGGPRRNSAVTPDFVRLHDDKSTFTGVYAKGGPTTVDKKITLASLTDRTTAEKGMVHT